jgi:small subunit ribosomal protein S8
MSMSDPLGDMLTRIRNAQARKLTSVVTPASNLRANVLEVLMQEGYIRSFERREAARGLPEIKIELKYHEGEPVIRTIKRISKPGRRVYAKIKDLPRPFNGLGIAVLSTPRGVMSDVAAREANVGGEVLCQIF